MTNAESSVRFGYWGLLLIALLALKFTLWFLDPDIGFYFGDSASYLYTAVSGWIPPDRSYTYGFFVRHATLMLESLDWLVINQVLIPASMDHSKII